MTVPSFTKSGSKATTATTLDKKVFSHLPKNHELLKAAYVSYLANGRRAGAKAKRRGEVSGGGRKPWKQKGTGRARFGSSRNPIWRGGGVAFGPTGEQNYTHKLSTSAKQSALRQALSLAAQDNKLVVIEAFDAKDAKVAQTVKLLEKIGAQGNILMVVDTKDDLVERATRNLASLKTVQAAYLNVFDVLNADTVVVSQKALAIITEKWAAKDVNK